MIKFFIKGLLRDRSRSLFPLLTVVIGVFLTVVFYCWVQGLVGICFRPRPVSTRATSRS